MRGHFWFDSGLAGLYFIASTLARQDEWSDVVVGFERDGVTIEAPDDRLKSFVEACYEDLASRWWNVSTEKQEQSPELVVYDREKQEFRCMPRRMPTPVAGLSVSATSWRAEGDDFENLASAMQQETEKFLQDHKKGLWGTRKRLLYEQPVCHPQLELFPQKGKKRICSVCGQAAVCENVSQTSFPLFSSQSATFSFNSEVGSPDILCRECDLLGKFAVHAAHFKIADSWTHVMQLNSGNMKTLLKAHENFGCMSPLRVFDRQTLYYQNFGKNEFILQRGSLPYEVLWGFYIAAYGLLLKNRKDRKRDSDEDELSPEMMESIAALNVVLMSLEDKGQTFIVKEIVNYTDSTYLFRLIAHVFTAVRQTFKDRTSAFWDGLFMDFYVILNPQKQFDPANGLYRNRILQRVLEKCSILQDVERFVFMKSLKVDYPSLGRILFFLKLYEPVVRGRDSRCKEGYGMTKEQIEIATKLGAQIVLSAKEILSEDGNTDSLKAVKGDLFSLRKTRTPVAFLEQLNRLQFRYGITVNREIAAGILEASEVPFEDFKAYCMISALNSFNGIMRPRSDSKETVQKQN